MSQKPAAQPKIDTPQKNAVALYINVTYFAIVRTFLVAVTHQNVGLLAPILVPKS